MFFNYDIWLEAAVLFIIIIIIIIIIIENEY